MTYLARLIQITFPKLLLLKWITVVNPIALSDSHRHSPSQVCLLYWHYLHWSNRTGAVSHLGVSWSHHLLTRCCSASRTSEDQSTEQDAHKAQRQNHSQLVCFINSHHSDPWPPLQLKLKCLKRRLKLLKRLFKPSDLLIVPLWDQKASSCSTFFLIFNHSAGCKLMSAAVYKRQDISPTDGKCMLMAVTVSVLDQQILTVNSALLYFCHFPLMKAFVCWTLRDKAFCSLPVSPEF